LSIRTQRSTRLKAATIVAVLVASLFAFVSPAAAAIDTTRYAGTDRYETAALAALDAFGPASVNNIVLASGENFPDGLAAAYLGGAAEAPVLLTATNSLPASTANAIGALQAGGVTTVHIVGGTAAVGPAVRTQLSNLGYTLNEIGGATRYDTAQNVAAAANTIGGVGTFQGQRTAIVVTGANFPDALSAGALAYAGDHPIVLTTPNALSTQADTTLTNLNIQQVIILGGTAAVAPAVADAITAKGIDVVRVSGANRFATAAALANVLTTEGISGGAGWDGTEAVLAYGLNFPDALVAAQVGGRNLAPIVLTSSVPTDTCNFLGSVGSILTDLYVMGGTAAISAATLEQAVNCAEAEAPTATITALDGRTSFTVEYSAAVINSTDAANYRVNNSGATITGVTAGAAGSNTVTVTLNTPLAPNDLITVNPAAAVSKVQTGAGGIVPLTNFVVQADTTRPSVILARFFAGQTMGFVFLSEAVTHIGAPGITVDGANVATVDPLGAPPTTAWRVGHAAADAGDSVQILANTFQDVATTPNTNLAFSTIVTTDNTAPTLLSASYTTSPLDNAFRNIGGVRIEARPTGIATGHLGNAWSVEGVVTAGPGVTVQVNTNTRVIRIGAPNLAAIPTADAVIALANNAAFNANFFSVVDGAGATFNLSAGALAGGTSTVRVLTQWSEQLRPLGLGSTLSGTALVPSPGAGNINPGADAAAPFLGQWVITYTTPTDGPIATQIVPPAGSIWDLATNQNAATAANITAG
jgi:putative cell wall-binding protein